MENSKQEVRSILIIDDDRDDYELVHEAVQQIDPQITVSYMGDNREPASQESFAYDLVLLDINMPGHDGFYWLNKIRSRGHCEVPVVMYTNSRSPIHIAKAYEEGASLYFSKPDSFIHLREGLKKLIAMNWSDPLSAAAECKSDGCETFFKFNS